MPCQRPPTIHGMWSKAKTLCEGGLTCLLPRRHRWLRRQCRIGSLCPWDPDKSSLRLQQTKHEQGSRKKHAVNLCAKSLETGGGAAAAASDSVESILRAGHEHGRGRASRAQKLSKQDCVARDCYMAEHVSRRGRQFRGWGCTRIISVRS